MSRETCVGGGAEEAGPVVTAVSHRPSGGLAGDAAVVPVVRAVLRLGEALECRLAAALTGLSGEALGGVLAALEAGRSPRWALGLARDERHVRERLAAMSVRDPRVDDLGRRRARARALLEAAETLEARAAEAGVGRAGAGR